MVKVTTEGEISSMKQASYHGPPVAGLTRIADDEEPEPRQGGKIYPVSEEAMANLRRVLASQPPRPQPRGYRKRQQNNLVENLLRRQRELQEAGRLPVKKKGGGIEELVEAFDSEPEAADGPKEKNMRGKKFSDEEWREYYDLYIAEEEMTLDDVAATMGNTPSTVSNHFRRLGLPAKRQRNGPITVSTDDEELEPVDAEPAAEPMTPAHPDYDDWRRGTEAADLPAFWQPPAPVATNGTHDHVGAQTLAPSALSTALAELASLMQSGRVTGRVSIQLDLNFEIGGDDA